MGSALLREFCKALSEEFNPMNMGKKFPDLGALKLGFRNGWVMPETVPIRKKRSVDEKR